MRQFPPSLFLPGHIVHADWSVNPRKRWMAAAELGDDGQYTASAPQAIRDAGLFMLTLLNAAENCVLIGFDFPIGLPLAYARKAKINNFLTALTEFGADGWTDFYRVASSAEEIGLRRPFYPASPGGKRRAHLTAALGIADLRRQCDRQTSERRAAAEMFWTLGAQQVGKAAISGWQELLAPAVKLGSVVPLSIWPFSGTFDALLKPGRVVACEAYPGEFYGHLDVRFPAKTSKRRQVDRAANAPALLAFADKVGIRLDPALHNAIVDGFGKDTFGEDRFDSLVGLFGMLNVALGYRAPGEPRAPEIQQIEGWILGMANEHF
ncbi:MAG: hypothetical protein ABI835_06435 [Chloroflexota bacterium]